MGKDNRQWRKQVKKLRRSRIRTTAARERDKILATTCVPPSPGGDEDEVPLTSPEGDEERRRLRREEEEAEWILREEQAQLEFRMKEAEKQAQVLAKEATEKRIRAEWEEIKKVENQMKEKNDQAEKERTARQEEEFNKLLDFLSGDIDNPPQPYLMPEVLDDGQEICSYFARTAVCRFYDRCERAHPRPTLSSTILIPNFFSNFSLEQSLCDEFDTDLSLEYEDSDMNKEFLEFYEDVIPEFRTIGKVVQFKVCRNFAPHLRGNVYVQFDNIREAVQAYRVFNARFYNLRQLTLQFVRVPSWKSAICGMFNRRKCTKGMACNFLHVFRNPTREFVAADNDWAELPPPPRIILPVSERKSGRDALAKGDLRDEISESSRSRRSRIDESASRTRRMSTSNSNSYSSLRHGSQRSPRGRSPHRSKRSRDIEHSEQKSHKRARRSSKEEESLGRSKHSLTKKSSLHPDPSAADAADKIGSSGPKSHKKHKHKHKSKHKKKKSREINSKDCKDV